MPRNRSPYAVWVDTSVDGVLVQYVDSILTIGNARLRRNLINHREDLFPNHVAWIEPSDGTPVDLRNTFTTEISAGVLEEIRDLVERGRSLASITAEYRIHLNRLKEHLEGHVMTEKELQRLVMEICEEMDLTVFHSFDSRRDTGVGYPDLTILGPGGIIFAELKSDSGHLTTAQTLWRNKFLYAGLDWYLWRPLELHRGEIRAILMSLAQEPPLSRTIDLTGL
jgi:hypothetical protein